MNYIRSLPHVSGPLAETRQDASRREASATTMNASHAMGRDSPRQPAEAPASADSGVTLSASIVRFLNESDASGSGPLDGQAIRDTSDLLAADSPSDLERALGAARNLVAGTVAGGVHVAADALVGGIDVVATGLQLAVRGIEGAIEESTSDLTTRAAAAVGYATLSGIAGAAALNELV